MKSLYFLFFVAGLTLVSCTQTKTTTLQIISYNIHHGADQEEVLTINGVGEFLKTAKPDFVGLQEVDSLCNRSAQTDQMQILADSTGMHAAFGRHFPYDGGSYGLGLLSAFPLSDIRNDRITSKSVDGEERSLALLSAVATLPGGHKIRFATVHLALDQPTRMIQAKEVLEYLKEDDNIPVILTGDMNAEPDNEAIKILLQDFSLTDTALSHTFPVDNAVKKIDYILVRSKNLDSVKASKVLYEEDYSDHLPLWSTVNLKF